VTTKQKQPDLSSWDLLNDFSIDEAACLWAGIDPTTEETKRSQLETSKLVPIGYLLTKAVEEEKLPIIKLKPNRYGKALFEDMRVTREDLKVFAESIGVQPAFIFNASETKTGVNESPVTKSNAGRHSACSKEIWLERLAILILTNKINLNDTHDTIAQALLEDLNGQKVLKFPVSVNTIIKDWTGPIVRQAIKES